jgi:hypothetical protein
MKALRNSSQLTSSITWRHLPNADGGVETLSGMGIAVQENPSVVQVCGWEWCFL